MSHPLDKPIWSALTSRQAHFALGDALAKRFPADISPFIVARDNSAAAVAAMAVLMTENEEVALLECAPPAPPPEIACVTKPVVQMVAGALRFRAGDFAVRPLGDADAAEMLALAILTRPGPFCARTPLMGRFIGIRDGGRLVAMCGERLALDGYVEVSALCTHPDHRGRGYGEALLGRVAARILHEGDTPFLHCYASNTGAIALYRRMGFTHRADVTHAAWKRVS